MRICLALLIVFLSLNVWAKNNPTLNLTAMPGSNTKLVLTNPHHKHVEKKVEKSISVPVKKKVEIKPKPIEIKLPGICGLAPIKSHATLKDFVKNIFKLVLSRIKPCETETNKAPVSQFSYIPVEPYVGDIVTLKSQASDDKGIKLYEWIISDGRVLQGEVVGVVFDKPGRFTVTHVVQDNEGLENEISKEIVLLQHNTPPVAQLTASYSGNGPFEILLDASSSSDDEKIVNYRWYHDSQLIGDSPVPTLTYVVFDENDYKFKVIITDSSGLTSENSVSIKVSSQLPPEGIFISGVDIINLDSQSPSRKYHFYIKENINGIIQTLDNQLLELEALHPGLDLYNNVLTVQHNGDTSHFPDEVVLKITVNSSTYLKRIKLVKTLSRLIGVVSAGPLSSYTILDQDSVFKGAKVNFSGNQISLSELRIYESNLSGGKISLTMSNSHSQFFEYTLSEVSKTLTQAVDLSDVSHFSIVEKIDEYEAMLLSTLSYFACSNVPNVYFMSATSAKSLFKQEVDGQLRFYKFDPSQMSIKNRANEEMVENLFQKYKSTYKDVQLIYFREEFSPDKLGFVNSRFKDTIWVNLEANFNLNTVLGFLNHENQHLIQNSKLGCDKYKLSHPLDTLVLESHAEYGTILNPDIPEEFSSTNYAQDAVYDMRKSYLGFVEENFFEKKRDISGMQYYRSGSFWDHLDFDDFVSKVKSKRIMTLSGNPYRGMHELLGKEHYLNFVSNLILYNYHPNQVKSPFSYFVANLYANFPVQFSEEYYYVQEHYGTAQKVNVLKPWETGLNKLSFDKLTQNMDEATKKNLRFKFLVYPSDVEELVEGFEEINVTLSNLGESAPKVTKTLWAGDGEEPNEYEFLVDFDDFTEMGVPKEIQVILTNTNNEKTIPVYTTIIPEIKKRICYNGPSSLQVDFTHKSEGHLSDYSNNIFNETVASGTCRDFYLIYKQGYFYDLSVRVGNGYGYFTNWSQKQYEETGVGYVYNYFVNTSGAWDVRAEALPYGENNGYIINLTVEQIDASTIYIH